MDGGYWPARRATTSQSSVRSKVNEQCTKFLLGFLQGTTDAKDNCEGIGNAYVAAKCGSIKGSSSYGKISSHNTADDDSYFEEFSDRQCCASLRTHYYEYCDESEILNDHTLLVIAAAMLLCECAKSIVKKYHIRWIPEAAACMLVGMIVALGARVFGTNIDDIGFDEEIFMYLLLPPIIFEAALAVNKRQFRRRRGAIMIFAVFGTLLSSYITGAAVYYSAKYFGQVQLSALDSLIFGALISSIDPVAILSVLTSLKMSETDTIYILVFGESLLNDGVAITLFKSLVQQYESPSDVTSEEIRRSIADFLIICFGSIAIGLTCGVACLCYFHLNSSIMNPVMEVASFFLWAVVPYWMAEAFHWSGIVAIVVMGFFMDIYLRPGGDHTSNDAEEQHRGHGDQPKMGPGGLEYYSWDDDDNEAGLETVSETKQPPPIETVDSPNSRAPIVRLSCEADEHVHFVAHILSSLSENAIFAYMGLFIFSSKYKWDAVLCSIGVTSCVVSRAIMVVISSWIIWYMHVFRQRAGCQRIVMSACEDRSMESNAAAQGVDPLQTPISKSARALSNYKVQVVLILAGLRGAVSLALVENIPIYNGVTGIGSKNKPLIKAMTSSSIIFTIFVLGGGAYYILKWLDISSDDMLIKSHGKTEAYNSSLFCGASTDINETLGEMELSVRSLSRTSLYSAHPQLQLEQSSSQSRGVRTFVPSAMLE